MSCDIITYNMPTFVELASGRDSSYCLLGFVQQMIGGRAPAEDFPLTHMGNGFKMTSSCFAWVAQDVEGRLTVVGAITGDGETPEEAVKNFALSVLSPPRITENRLYYAAYLPEGKAGGDRTVRLIAPQLQATP